MATLRHGSNTAAATFDGAIERPARPTRTVSLLADPARADRVPHARIDARVWFTLHRNGPWLTTGLVPDERMHQLRFDCERASRHKRHEVHIWLTPSKMMNRPGDDRPMPPCSRPSRACPRARANVWNRGERSTVARRPDGRPSDRSARAGS